MRTQWPRFNSEMFAGLKDLFWPPIITFILFFIHRGGYVLLVVVDWEDSLA